MSSSSTVDAALLLHDASDHLPVSAKIIFSNEIVIPDNNPPIVSDTLFYINEVPEDNFFIGSLNAVDPDEDDLSFKILSGNESNFFKIDNEGNLRVDNGSEITYNNFQSFILIIFLPRIIIGLPNSFQAHMPFLQLVYLRLKS